MERGSKNFELAQPSPDTAYEGESEYFQKGGNITARPTLPPFRAPTEFELESHRASSGSSDAGARASICGFYRASDLPPWLAAEFGGWLVPAPAEAQPQAMVVDEAQAESADMQSRAAGEGADRSASEIEVFADLPLPDPPGGRIVVCAARPNRAERFRSFLFRLPRLDPPSNDERPVARREIDASPQASSAMRALRNAEVLAGEGAAGPILLLHSHTGFRLFDAESLRPIAARLVAGKVALSPLSAKFFYHLSAEGALTRVDAATGVTTAEASLLAWGQSPNVGDKRPLGLKRAERAVVPTDIAVDGAGYVHVNGAAYEIFSPALACRRSFSAAELFGADSEFARPHKRARSNLQPSAAGEGASNLQPSAAGEAASNLQPMSAHFFIRPGGGPQAGKIFAFSLAVGGKGPSALIYDPRDP